MYELAKCCKFCLTLCSRTLKTASQTMCWPAHARIGRLSYHLVSESDIIHKPSTLLYIGISLKSGLGLDYSRCEHKFKSMAYFVIVLINKFEIIGFHIALSSTYGSSLQHLSARKFYVSFLFIPKFRLTFFDRKNHLQRDKSTINHKKSPSITARAKETWQTKGICTRMVSEFLTGDTHVCLINARNIVVFLASIFGGALEYGILGYDFVCFLRMFANVWRNVLPPFSRRP